jgi:hypothetical protein
MRNASSSVLCPLGRLIEVALFQLEPVHGLLGTVSPTF